MGNVTGVRPRLTHNTLWNLTGNAAPLAVAVVCIPVLVRHLGTERFGLLTLVWMLVGYFSLFDFGLGRALTQVVASRLAVETSSSIAELARNALAIMFGIGALTAMLMVCAAHWLVHSVIKVPIELREEALISFVVIALATPLTVATVGLQGLLAAYHRFDYVNYVKVPLGIFTFAGAAAVLPFSRSLVPIALTLVVGRVAALFACWFLSKRVIAGLRLKGALRLTSVYPLLPFAGWMSVTNIVSPIMNQMDRLFIGATLSITAVAYYATPFEFVTKVLVIPGAFVTVLIPTFANRVDDIPAAESLFDRSLIYILPLVLPFLILSTALAVPGLRLWLGPAFAENSSAVLRWLSLGVFLNCIAQFPSGALQGLGRPDLTAKFHLLELPLYVGTLLIMIKYYGVTGAAVAWTLRVALDCVVLLIWTGKLLPNAHIKRIFVLLALAIAGFALASLPRTLIAGTLTSLALTTAGGILIWSLYLNAAERLSIAEFIRSSYAKTSPVPEKALSSVAAGSGTLNQ